MKSKLGRNLKPGDVILLGDATDYPTRYVYAEVTSVAETSPGFRTGRRMWRISYRVVKKTRGRAWFQNDSTCYSDDRYDIWTGDLADAPLARF